MDLPGVPKNKIVIDNEPGQLIIHGETRPSEHFESASSRVRERNIGKFRKIIRLPTTVEPEKAKATCENGLLEIKVRNSRDSKVDSKD